MSVPPAERNVAIFHGAGNDSRGNWFPWLKRNLETKRRNREVWTPDLPNSETPKTQTWLNYVRREKGQDLTYFNNALLVGHSAGATFIFRLLEALPDDIKVDKTILVGGFVDRGTIEEYYHYKDGLVEGGFNWEKIKASCRNFTFVHSDNDQYECGIDQGRIMQEHLGGELIFRPGEGHFNLEVNPNYKELPLLLSLVD
jgi:predicted alpha/beta hydrolase family esterase